MCPRTFQKDCLRFARTFWISAAEEKKQGAKVKLTYDKIRINAKNYGL